jgi:dihydroneopterin aldolase
MSDAIFVTGLLVHAHHGVMRHEKKVGQQFVIDLELAIDLAEAGASDKLVDTVSYSSIVEAATRAFTAKSFRLVEAAAQAIADEVLASFPRVASVRVTVHKPHAPIAAIFEDVGVVLTRSRHPPAQS